MFSMLLSDTPPIPQESGGGDLVALLTAIAALSTALVAGVALVLEGRRTRRQLGLTNLWRLIDQWDQHEMRALRSRLAKRLLTYPKERRHISDDGVDVLNLFELVAYLVVKSKTLGVEDAWINFSPWAVSWWYLYQDGIRDLRSVDETLFEDFHLLVDRFVTFEAKRRDLTVDQVIPTEADLRNFLESEVHLVDRTREELGREPLMRTLLVFWRRRRARKPD